jgi:hypothetical protein
MNPGRPRKQEAAERWLKKNIGQGKVKAADIILAAQAANFCKSIVKTAKLSLGIRSERIDDVWYWTMAEKVEPIIKTDDLGYSTVPTGRNELKHLEALMKIKKLVQADMGSAEIIQALEYGTAAGMSEVMVITSLKGQGVMVPHKSELTRAL